MFFFYFVHLLLSWYLHKEKTVFFLRENGIGEIRKFDNIFIVSYIEVIFSILINLLNTKTFTYFFKQIEVNCI